MWEDKLVILEEIYPVPENIKPYMKLCNFNKIDFFFFEYVMEYEIQSVLPNILDIMLSIPKVYPDNIFSQFWDSISFYHKLFFYCTRMDLIKMRS